ncbi:MAG TPA: DUF4202 domain-containing protein [Acidimicrobiales bacterium]
MDGRYEAAVAAIDAANADDPETIVVDGVRRPKELAHADLMVAWVQRLDPTADEAQLLAARASHLRRWSIARTSYPEGRAGYLRWRSDLRKQHAAEVTEILTTAGYESATAERVSAIVGKVGLGSDPAVQVHEDALCLVFLQTQLAPTAQRLGADKAVSVLAKTAAKMSPAALALVAELDLSDAEQALLRRALGSP